MRIVIDSSVWIAGIGSRTGFASEVISKSYKNIEIEIFISEKILDEIEINLIKKLKSEDLLAKRTRDTVRNLGDFEVEINSQEENAVKIIKYNPDKHILALCKKIKAQYLISFDHKHLLPLKKFGKTKILEPKDFIRGIEGLKPLARPTKEAEEL